MYRIAVVEDDRPTNDTFAGYVLKVWPDCVVEQYFDFDAASRALGTSSYDLVICDIDLGAGSDKYGGIKISKALNSTRTPLLVVSGLPQPDLHREICRALDAWDYLQKPVTEADFRNQVVRAVMYRQAVVQRGEGGASTPQRFSRDPDITIDLHSRVKVRWKGKPVSLSLTQVRLLETLVRNANTPVAYETLFEQIDSGRNKENLRVHIAAIRTALKDADPAFDDRLHNTPMLGYLWRV
jgi:DNA-binding response OmpR family regulator